MKNLMLPSSLLIAFSLILLKTFTNSEKVPLVVFGKIEVNYSKNSADKSQSFGKGMIKIFLGHEQLIDDDLIGEIEEDGSFAVEIGSKERSYEIVYAKMLGNNSVSKNETEPLKLTLELTKWNDEGEYGVFRKSIILSKSRFKELKNTIQVNCETILIILDKDRVD